MLVSHFKTYAFYTLLVIIIKSDRDFFSGVFFFLFLFCVYLVISGLFREKNKIPILFFGVYVVFASLWITYSWNSLPTTEISSAGIESYSEIQQEQFNDLAENYITEDDFQSGAITACSDLFSISPDGYLYQNSTSLSQADCEDWGGSYSGAYEDPFQDGYYSTIEEMFSQTPYWCWGEECLTREDF